MSDVFTKKVEQKLSDPLYTFKPEFKEILNEINIMYKIFKGSFRALFIRGKRGLLPGLHVHAITSSWA